MLASLDSFRVSKYDIEPSSNGMYEGSYGPVRRAKIHSKGRIHIPKVIVQVIQPCGDWTQHMPVLEVRQQDFTRWLLLELVLGTNSGASRLEQA